MSAASQHLKLGEKKAKKIIQAKVRDLRSYFRKFGFKNGIIGLSGGLDSAVACVLAVKALGDQNVIVVLMPYQGIGDSKGIVDALKLAKNLKIPKKNILIVPVNKAVDTSWSLLKKYKGKEKIRFGNLMARERMKILFDLSQVFKAIVIGTENRTEEELGYYTLWGDQASGLEPIKNLWKTQIYEITTFLPEIPKEILEKSPSPGLWKNQTAEKELGFSYFEADIVLSAFLDLKMKPKEVEKKFRMPKKKIDLILAKAKIGEIKRKVPYILKNQK